MNTSSYLLNLPARVCFGCGAVKELNTVLPAAAERILIVSGTHLLKDGTTDRIAATLTDRSVQIISGIAPEPPLEDVDRVIAAGRDFRAQAVVAIGGGSIIDTAKAAAAIISADGWCSDYFSGKKTIDAKGLFFAALPATAGTGAEMTKNSVLTDAATQVKKSLRSPFMTADAAIVDPELTYSCPPVLTAASGLDAFVQATEAYTNPAAGTYTKALALKALRLIDKNLERACSGDHDARNAMAEGSMLAGMAFAPCGLGAVHGLAHPVGSLLHVPHGVACAVLMPYIFEFNTDAAARDYADMAFALDLLPPSASCGDPADAAAVFVEESKRLAKALNILATFADYGLTDEHFPFIVKNCRSASMKSNPRHMSDEDVLDLLQKLKK